MAINLEAQYRRTQLENPGTDVELRLQELERAIAAGITAAPTETIPGGVRSGINNMIRNGDHNHSVNSWFEDAPSSDDDMHECHNAYAYPPIEPIAIDSGAMTTASDVLDADSNTFTSEMVGRYVLINGAGVSGGVLSARIITFNSDTQVVLDTAASTTVSGATGLINLLRLTHVNFKNTPAATVSDVLKDAAHSNFGANIQDPAWRRENGIVMLGSRNLVGYSLGHFANDGTSYIPLHQLFPGREPFFRFNIARANPYVYSPGRLFCGIYNNNVEVLSWVSGAPFTLSAAMTPDPPPSTISTEYMVVIETGQGYTLVSETVTVTDAPTDAAFSTGARVTLVWQYFAGAIKTTVYRKRTGQNVFKMQEFSTGASSWTDVNLSSRVDTGSSTFPVFDDQQGNVPSYWASAAGELDDVTWDGQPNRYWQPVIGYIPFGPTISLSRLIDPHFIIGLTEPLATRVTDAVTIDGNSAVTSASGVFTPQMEGKSYILESADMENSIAGTILEVFDEFNVDLSDAPDWDSDDSVLVILDSQPNGLYIDLVGLALNLGEWEYHIDDNNRPQTAAANPNGSTQGGTGGGPPTGTGGVGGVIGVGPGKIPGIGDGEPPIIIIERTGSSVGPRGLMGPEGPAGEDGNDGGESYSIGDLYGYDMYFG